jgi:four helix bundle protein
MTNEEREAARLPDKHAAVGARKYDLGERTARLAESVIGFVRTIKVDCVTSLLIRQLVRSATSIGANYCEADEAGSGKEFRYRISVCNRETRETKHWLRMLAVAVPEQKEKARVLWKETHELSLIFSAIYHRSRTKQS